MSEVEYLPRHSSEIHLLWGPLKKSSYSNEGPLFENLCCGVVPPSPPCPYPHSQMTLLGGMKAGGGPNLSGEGEIEMPSKLKKIFSASLEMQEIRIILIC